MAELLVVDRAITSLSEISEAALMRGPQACAIGTPGLRGGVRAERPPVRLDETHQ